MLKKWDFEATRKLTNDILYTEFKFIPKIELKEIKTVMDSFFANNLDFKNEIKFMKKEFVNFAVPEIDDEVLKSIKGISDTIRSLYVPTLLNNPNCEENDEE